jgi:predicted nucleic acid-binding protein
VSGYLLDTNIISMLAPTSAEVPANVGAWLERADAEGRLFLTVVTIHEIEKGIALLERKRAKAKAAKLKAWLAGLIESYADKIIAYDTQAAALAGRLEANAIAEGHHPGMADAAIAGIAQAHGLTIITRNARHFLPFGIAVLSPEEVAASTK